MSPSAPSAVRRLGAAVSNPHNMGQGAVVGALAGAVFGAVADDNRQQAINRANAAAATPGRAAGCRSPAYRATIIAVRCRPAWKAAATRYVNAAGTHFQLFGVDHDTFPGKTLLAGGVLLLSLLTTAPAFADHEHEFHGGHYGHEHFHRAPFRATTANSCMAANTCISRVAIGTTTMARVSRPIIRRSVCISTSCPTAIAACSSAVWLSMN